jgi:hypothetical protein
VEEIASKETEIESEREIQSNREGERDSEENRDENDVNKLICYLFHSDLEKKYF